jgi:trans-aconitate methyltransferase
MSLQHKLIAQFGKPAGMTGEVVAWLMSVSSRSLSQWTIEYIPVNPTDKVLEIGYGNGRTFKKMADRLPEGFIAGVDHSELMYKKALKRNRQYCNTSRAILQCGTIHEIAFPPYYFDTIFGNNVHFFWNNPVHEFYRLRSLLRPGGKLVMIFQPRWAKSAKAVQEIAIETSVQFQLAGFSDIQIDYKPMRQVDGIAVSGINRHQSIKTCKPRPADP